MPRVHLALPALLWLLLPVDAALAQRTMSQVMAESFDGGASVAVVQRSPAPPATAMPATGAPALAAQSAPGTAPRDGAGGQTADTPPVYPAAPRASAPLQRLAADAGYTLGRVVDGLHELVIPAERLQAIPAADPSMDCRRLYEETGRLVRLSNRYRPAFHDDPRNQAIGAIGLVHTSAFYALGVTAYAAWYEDGHRAEARERLRELRRLMADRRCFARD